jgi:hypothetical protein
MSERALNSTTQQVIDGINTQRDVEAISNYIMLKFEELNLNAPFKASGREIYRKLGINWETTNCNVILASVEHYLEMLEKEIEEKKEAERVLDEYEIQVNSIPNNPEHA